jgi:predicted Zn-dependent protease
MAAQVENAVRFTNQNEMEADRIGMRVLAEANFDPMAMPRFFEELQARTRYYENEYSNFLRDHPVTSERISDAQARARHYPPIQLIESRGYLLAKARVGALTAGNLGQSERVFADQAARAQGTARDAALYGQGLVLLRAGSPAKAIPLFADLAQRQPCEPAYRLSLADAQLAQGKLDDALVTYAQAVTVFPDNIALVLAYSTALLQAGKSAPAWQQLQRLPVDRNTPAEQFRLLAQAAQSLDRIAQMHDLLAEYALRRGNARQALEQWHIALNTPDPQHILNAEGIKKRMREIERMLHDMQNG